MRFKETIFGSTILNSLMSGIVVADITIYQSSFTADTDYAVIVYEPNSLNDRFQFKVSSNETDEYVHLKSCSLSLADKEYKQEFIRDGCVKPDWTKIFENSDRVMSNNADWFTMRPLFIGIKSKWHIDCSVASCSSDVHHYHQDDFKRFCKAGDHCSTRYQFTDDDYRERRWQKIGSKVRFGEVQVEFDPSH